MIFYYRIGSRRYSHENVALDELMTINGFHLNDGEKSQEMLSFFGYMHVYYPEDILAYESYIKFYNLVSNKHMADASMQSVISQALEYLEREQNENTEEIRQMLINEMSSTYQELYVE